MVCFSEEEALEAVAAVSKVRIRTRALLFSHFSSPGGISGISIWDQYLKIRPRNSTTSGSVGTYQQTPDSLSLHKLYWFSLLNFVVELLRLLGEFLGGWECGADVLKIVSSDNPEAAGHLATEFQVYRAAANAKLEHIPRLISQGCRGKVN